MKKLVTSMLLAFAFVPSLAFAEGDANHDWAEKAAKGYEMKAAAARKGGNEAAAKIYDRMAQIKRDAGAASKDGQKFSWDEYHELEGKLNAIKHDKKGHHKKGHDKKGHDKKKDWSEKKKDWGDKKHSDKKSAAGQGFLKTAEEYRKKASEAMAQGDEAKASIYTELANMKIEAAANAAQGKGYDWTRYFELKKRLK